VIGGDKVTDIVHHEDLVKLQQYHISLYREIERFEKDNPKFKNGSNISRLTRKVVEVSTRIADKRITGGANVSNPVSNFWALVVGGFLVLAVGISIGIGYMAIADLENCIYKGMCIETPKKGN